jgi:hypothetical protein
MYTPAAWNNRPHMHRVAWPERDAGAEPRDIQSRRTTDRVPPERAATAGSIHPLLIDPPHMSSAPSATAATTAGEDDDEVCDAGPHSEDDMVQCAVCGEQYWEESSGVIHCDVCEDYYCQKCCWSLLPDDYKSAHEPKENELAFDGLCDWCKWDVSWESKDIAKLLPPVKKM